MAVLSVPGMNFGIVPVDAAQKTSVQQAATEAAKIPLYEGFGPYTQPASCIITQLPIVDPSWETQQDPQTVCADAGSIRESTKTNQVVANGTMTLLYDKVDPMMALIQQVRASIDQRIAYEMLHQNMTDKIFAIVQVLRASIDPTDTTGRVQSTVEFLYDTLPVHN